MQVINADMMAVQTMNKVVSPSCIKKALKLSAEANVNINASAKAASVKCSNEREAHKFGKKPKVLELELDMLY
jgi:hypothetical protein